MESENILRNWSGDTNKPGKEKKKSTYGWGTKTEISSLSKIKCLQKNVTTPTGDRTEYQNYAEGLRMVPGAAGKHSRLGPSQI